MSTRCNIKIIDKDCEVILYHHHDGYPAGVGADLFDKFNAKLKDKNCYLSAEDIANSLIKDPKDDEYEWTSDIHGDIEYLYEIDLVKRELRCFPVDWTGENWDVMKKGEPIDLEEDL